MAATAVSKHDDTEQTVPQPSQQSSPHDCSVDLKTSSGSHPPTDTSLVDIGEGASACDGIGSDFIEAKATVSSDTGNDNSGGSLSDVEKKIRRAERFGVPVKLSEQEKRNSRAERFGTMSASHGSDALKKSEEQKRKARAERFGLVQSVPDDEAKKKARHAQFAKSLKTGSVEEDKRKARAVRFSQSLSSPMLPENINGKVDPKAATADNASGVD